VAREGGPAALVPSSALTASGALWSAGGEHVAGIAEVVRTAEGHAVVVPLCTRSIADLAAERGAAGQSFHPGEVVTLVVSLLRGVLSESSAHGIPLCRGEWWLDGEGAPRFVHDDAGVPADEAAVLAVHAVGRACGQDAATVDALDHAARGLADVERLSSSSAVLETELFALAVPEPVGVQVLARRGRTRVAASAAPEPAARPAWRRLADAADAGVAEMFSQAATSLWHMLRHRPPREGRPRRGKLLVACACGALVLAAGLLWPGGDDAPGGSVGGAIDGDVAVPSASTTASVEAGQSSPTPEAGSGGTPAAPDDDIVVSAGALLDEIRGCDADIDCRRPLLDEDSALLVDAADPRWQGAAFATTEARRLTLLDDVGGLVLLRAEDVTGARAAQVVAVVRGEEKWVLRDIHDVAQHPG
jgi:hypothetical protein